MKTKPIIIILLTGLLTTSCIKDYIGHGGDKIELTSENYLYEGDLYTIHLETKIESLDIKIQELEDIIANNQGDQNTQKELDAANEERSLLTEDLKSIISLEQVGLKLPPPPPPCPRPRNCDFSGLEYLLVNNNVKEIEVLFYNENESLIGGGSSNQFSPYPESNGQINYSRIMIDKYTGSVVKIEVIIKTFDEKEYSYFIK